MAFELAPPSPRHRRGSAAGTFRLTVPKLKLTENDVERQINDYLRLRGWRLTRLHCGKARFPGGQWVELHAAGTADWLATRGRPQAAMYWEAKAPGEQPSAAQLAFLEQARREGYAAGWFDSLPAFLAWYRQMFE